ncbi:hypothetical protein AVEN_133773-1 [Araneus ventricosus]|uniref:Uncharacterized protein n=1 Tax=Araneus ventricosus TaxID=182803 RepID=A0A4Y2VJV0_ARAVE|nr:hypothetical protein AVEN_133773-1 [Araneus ventricosus]
MLYLKDLSGELLFRGPKLTVPRDCLMCPFLTFLKLDEEVDGNLAGEILSHPIVSRNPHIFGLTLGNQVNFHTPKRAILSQCVSLEPSYQNLPYSYGTLPPIRLYLIARHRLTPIQIGSELFLTYDNVLDFWQQIGETVFIIDTMVHIGQHICVFNLRKRKKAIFDIVEERWFRRRRGFSREMRLNGWIVTVGKSYILLIVYRI